MLLNVVLGDLFFLYFNKENNMESKLLVFSENLDQNAAEIDDQIREESATDWSCWVDAGWGNGCLIA